MKTVAAMLVIAMLAVGPIAGLAGASAELREPYDVPVEAIKSYDVQGSNPRLDQGVGSAFIVAMVPHTSLDGFTVFILCESSPEDSCTGDIVTDA